MLKMLRRGGGVINVTNNTYSKRNFIFSMCWQRNKNLQCNCILKKLKYSSFFNNQLKDNVAKQRAFENYNTLFGNYCFEGENKIFSLKLIILLQ